MSPRVLKKTLSGLVMVTVRPATDDLHCVAHNSNRIRSHQLPSDDMDAMRVEAPMQGTIVSVDVSAGDEVVAGQQLMLIESMKMHHAIESPCDGTIVAVMVAVGATVMAGDAARNGRAWSRAPGTGG